MNLAAKRRSLEKGALLKLTVKRKVRDIETSGATTKTESKTGNPFSLWQFKGKNTEHTKTHGLMHVKKYP